jgi:hypothetical protein
MKNLTVLIAISLATACGGSSEQSPPPDPPPADPPVAPDPEPQPDPAAQAPAPVPPPAPTCAPAAVAPCAAGGPAPITIADARRRARRLRGQVVAISGTLRMADEACTEAECDNSCSATIVIGGAADTDPTIALSSLAPGAAAGSATEGFACNGDAGDPCDGPRPATRPPLCCAMAVSNQNAVASGTLAQDGTEIVLQGATVCAAP